MQKKVFYTEIAYLLGIITLAIGTALMEAADFGVSMVVAPAYLIYLKLSQIFPFFSFGMAEYILQAVLLVCMMIILKKFKAAYLFSFVTALLYGAALDGAMLLVALIPAGGMALRLAFYVAGLLFCSVGVSLFFHTYIPPEVYELFVKELSAKYKVDIHKFKTGYDCASCIVGLILSFSFFGLWHFEGIKLGTVICALINGGLIGRFSAFFERHWEFKDALKRRGIKEPI